MSRSPNVLARLNSLDEVKHYSFDRGASYFITITRINESKQTYDWTSLAESVRQYLRDQHADDVIVGAGATGISAALTVVQSGASVAILRNETTWITHG